MSELPLYQKRRSYYPETPPCPTEWGRALSLLYAVPRFLGQGCVRRDFSHGAGSPGAWLIEYVQGLTAVRARAVYGCLGGACVTSKAAGSHQYESDTPPRSKL